jgi:hypothetical protein
MPSVSLSNESDELKIARHFSSSVIRFNGGGTMPQPAA